jgi:hypothetical protein
VPSDSADWPRRSSTWEMPLHPPTSLHLFDCYVSSLLLSLQRIGMQGRGGVVVQATEHWLLHGRVGIQTPEHLRLFSDIISAGNRTGGPSLGTPDWSIASFHMPASESPTESIYCVCCNHSGFVGAVVAMEIEHCLVHKTEGTNRARNSTNEYLREQTGFLCPLLPQAAEAQGRSHARRRPK